MASVRTEEARERLLRAADDLFYSEGVHTVGIDRVIEHAGVAKATLYSAFGSKDELIRGYLTRRHEVWTERIAQRLATYDTPRDRLLGVFDWLGDVFAHPGFHGCAFMNATAEDRQGGPTEIPAGAYRESVKSLFRELAQEAGAAEPGYLAGQLAISTTGRRWAPEWTAILPRAPLRARSLQRSSMRRSLLAAQRVVRRQPERQLAGVLLATIDADRQVCYLGCKQGCGGR